MCFSATANFVGSAALGATGVITLTKVKLLLGHSTWLSVPSGFNELRALVALNLYVIRLYQRTNGVAARTDMTLTIGSGPKARYLRSWRYQLARLSSGPRKRFKVVQRVSILHPVPREGAACACLSVTACV
jgi:hypothetical protein